ncbi:hypothetical protein BX600DRAFT_115160 [Xylariales sp. PMI_506]|nr:hypothetical protein BX600DRAFT_115160 [Xylariales sp. PMI_506]
MKQSPTQYISIFFPVNLGHGSHTLPVHDHVLDAFFVRECSLLITYVCTDLSTIARPFQKAHSFCTYLLRWPSSRRVECLSHTHVYTRMYVGTVSRRSRGLSMWRSRRSCQMCFLQPHDVTARGQNVPYQSLGPVHSTFLACLLILCRGTPLSVF